MTDLITAHAEAERRVLYGALAAVGAGRPAPPGHRSLLDFVEQVSRHAPGSPAWRRAVAAARAAARAQFSAEKQLILDFRQRTDRVRREALGRPGTARHPALTQPLRMLQPADGGVRDQG